MAERQAEQQQQQPQPQPQPPRRTKAVTIYDIAEAAGVAASTVSRALTKPGRVSPETADRIRETAERLGYRGRAARDTEPEERSRSKVLLVSVTSLANLFFVDTLSGIQDEASASGYTVLLSDGRQNPHVEKLAIDRTLELADGIILISPRMPDAVIQQYARDKPVVVVNRVVRDVSSVVQNFTDGMTQVVEHLAELGHRTVTFISGPSQAWIGSVRRQALEKACRERGMSMGRIGPVEATIRGGVGAAAEWMQHRTTAVVAFNDDIALGFSYAVRERGLRVPDDVSVVGIDNTQSTSVFAPPLTSLAVAGHGQGAVAARRVLAELRGGPTTTHTTVVPMKLIERVSTGPAPGRN
ncbi:MAG: LacI family DNA-binding transcriptional regulator [Actinomycetota bacterium]